MTREQAAAYVNAQTACMLADLEAMKAANKDRENRGLSPAYGEGAFFELPEKYGLHHNAVLTTFMSASQ